MPRPGARDGAAGEVLEHRLAQLETRVTSLGLAAAHALHVVTGRIEDLEQRVSTLEPPDGLGAPSPVSPEEDAALTRWRDVLAEGLPAGARVLYAQPDADEIVAHLRAAGVDAYGITDAGTPYRPGPDVRFAPLLDHLRAVPERALGAVVLAGLPEAMSPGAIAPLVAELGRASEHRRDHLRSTVVVATSTRRRQRRSGCGTTIRSRHLAPCLSCRGDGRHRSVRPVRPELPIGGRDHGVKLGLVVPRYGVDVVGGIEHWLRLLCEHLVTLKGWQVDVFTTGAVSAATWADELPPGDSELGGVTVHRHRSQTGRDPRSGELGVLIGRGPAVVPDPLALRFIELVGPVCPAVLVDAEQSDCDLVAMTPYLFWPAVHGAARLGRRTIFHPAAHDEPELHLGIMSGVFGAVGGFAYNSYAEQALVERTFAIAHRPASVIGATVVEGSGDPAAARAALGLAPGEPFVLCVGRVERAKGSHVLADLWRLYRRRRRGAPRLVLLGPVHEALEEDADVIVAGRQPEDVKWGALAGVRVRGDALRVGVLQLGRARSVDGGRPRRRQPPVRRHGRALCAERGWPVVLRLRRLRGRVRPAPGRPRPAGAPGAQRSDLCRACLQLADHRGPLRSPGRPHHGQGAAQCLGPARLIEGPVRMSAVAPHPLLSRFAARRPKSARVRRAGTTPR